jgi:type II secretory pathway pseudopilin PulG
MLRALSADERGSLPIALLAIIIVGTVASVLTATMVRGQRSTRLDQSFEQSLQLAEVALDRMAAQVTARQATTSFTLPATPEYSGTATRNGDGWRLQATGVAADGTRRKVEANIKQTSVFNVAAFGRVGVDYNGANGADSYRSGAFSGSGASRTFTANPYSSYLNASNELIAPNGKTGKGYVATNGNLTLKGQAFSSGDGAFIHFAKERIDSPLAGATGFCGGAATTCSSWLSGNVCPASGPCLKYVREPIALPPVTLPSAPTGSFPGTGANTLSPGVHVFTSAKLDSATVIQGTPTNPTIIYLTGQLSVPNHARVNFESFSSRLVPRPSPSLRIYSASEGTAMSFGTHVQISAAIYAPRGAFGGGSQSHVWGSMVTNSIDNNGGTQFHYDESLAEADDVSPLVVANWVEVAP